MKWESVTICNQSSGKASWHMVCLLPSPTVLPVGAYPPPSSCPLSPYNIYTSPRPFLSESMDSEKQNCILEILKIRFQLNSTLRERKKKGKDRRALYFLCLLIPFELGNAGAGLSFFNLNSLDCRILHGVWITVCGVLPDISSSS